MILLTGSNGFLGSEIKRQLRERGFPFECYNRSQPTDGKQFGSIIHCAALKNGNEVSLMNANLGLTKSLLENLTFDKFIFVSSVSVYSSELTTVDEDSICTPNDAYGRSKLLAEGVIREMASNYSIIRPSSIFGNGMERNTFLPRIIRQAKKNKITLFGNGERKQNYIHVEDVASCIIQSLSIKDNAVLLAVGRKSIMNKEIAMEVARITGAAIEYTGIDQSLSREYDNTKTRNRLDWRPGYDVTLWLNEFFQKIC